MQLSTIDNAVVNALPTATPAEQGKVMAAMILAQDAASKLYDPAYLRSFTAADRTGTRYNR